MLPEKYLALTGWPAKRMGGWRDAWICPWVRDPHDTHEPWLVLPFLFILVWLMILLRRLDPAVEFLLGAVITAAILSTYCIVTVWSQRKEEEGTESRLKIPSSTVTRI